MEGFEADMYDRQTHCLEESLLMGNSDLISLFRKHDRLFTVIGALIVFLGFYVKEGVQERTKDLSSSLTRETAAYEMNQRLQEIKDALKTLQPPNYIPEFMHDSKGDFLIGSRDIVERDKVHIQEVVDVKNRISSLADLNLTMLKRLPQPSEEIIRETSEVNASVGTMQLELSHLITSFFEMYRASYHSDMKTFKGQSSKFDQQLAKVKHASYSADGVVATFGTRISEEIKLQTEKTESNLRITNLLSYALFFVGWSFGLAGKLFKLPALGGAGSGD
jgi:hypothetical protein